MKLVFPRLYVILDAVLLPTTAISFAQSLAQSGVELMQFRDKQATSRRLFDVHLELQAWAKPLGAKVIVNDRPDVAAVVGAGGVHVGQHDLGVEQVRRIVGTGCWIGVSTHSWRQFEAANASTADYIAIGPVFPTKTKESPDPVVGLDLIARARQATHKPLVAIGGMTLERAREAWQAGADCIAVARDVVCASNPGKRAAEYLEAAAGTSSTG